MNRKRIYTESRINVKTREIMSPEQAAEYDAREERLSHPKVPQSRYYTSVERDSLQPTHQWGRHWR